MRAVKAADMEPVYFRWNDDVSNLSKVDGYFLVGGFSYEDRGRAGMVAGRDPLFDFLRQEAAKGKPIIGNCNGAQVLVESGLIPNAQGLQMSLARNVKDGAATGFLNEWVWITPTCPQGHCCTANWNGAMHIPIAHGEGRFTTNDKQLWQQLIENNQVAFTYCDADGNPVDAAHNPNGSEFAAAGICNPEGNVVALMPHPERTQNGDLYFISLREWIESHSIDDSARPASSKEPTAVNVPTRTAKDVEIFIDTKITNNEERTVEQAARRYVNNIVVKQLKYLSVPKGDEQKVLGNLMRFNPNKETAYIRRGGVFAQWDTDTKQEVACDSILNGTVNLLRRDDPDTGKLGPKSESGVCYVVSGADNDSILLSNVLEVFGNPHSSSIEALS